MHVQVREIVGLAVGHVARRLVVGRPRGVEALRPRQRRLERAAVRALVAHRPHDDRRPVLVPLHAAAHTVHGGVRELRIVGDHPVPAFERGPLRHIRRDHARRAMALVIRLADHVEAQPVIQIVEMRRVRVMAGADRVDVMLLHQLQIPHDLLLRDHRPGHRIRVMPVHAMQRDPLPVHPQHTALGRDLADADMIHNRLAGRLDHNRVQVRGLRAPQVRVVDDERGGRARNEIGTRIVGAVAVRGRPHGSGGVRRIRRLGLDLGQRLVVLVEQRHRHRRGRAVQEVERDAHRRMAGLRHRTIRRRLTPIDLGAYRIVADRGGGAVQQVDIAEDAAHAELVLILQVATVAPLEHQHRQRIRAVRQHVGHIELARGVRDLRIPDEHAVEPHVEAGIHTLEIQERPRRGGITAMLERMQVHAARIVLRHIRRIERERIVHIRVLMPVDPMVLPDRRHRNRRIPRGAQLVRPRLVRYAQRVDEPAVMERGQTGLMPTRDLRVQIVDAGVIAEHPIPVQQREPVGIRAALADGVGARGGGDEVGPVRHGADMQGMGVLVVAGDEHACLL